MRQYLLLTSLLLLSFFLSLSALAQGDYKLETTGALASSDVSKSIQEAVEPQGTRLVSSQGATVCEVWLRKAIPSKQGGGGSADILYGGLSLGTLVGVLHFPNGGADFRGQPIKAGFYTLRYALIPQDGNHMGASAYRDFLLMGPAAVDMDLDKPSDFADLVKLSRQASGSAHPAILVMAPADKSVTPGSPKLVRDDQGHWVLEAQPKDFPIAIILVGKAEA